MFEQNLCLIQFSSVLGSSDGKFVFSVPADSSFSVTAAFTSFVSVLSCFSFASATFLLYSSLRSCSACKNVHPHQPSDICLSPIVWSVSRNIKPWVVRSVSCGETSGTFGTPRNDNRSFETLPEAQRTQKLTPWLGLNLATTWHLLHLLQICPPYGATCNS